MNHLVRTVLIGLLTLAITAQGAAAATMAFCGPDHHDVVAVATPGEAVSADHVHPGPGVAVNALAHVHTLVDGSPPTAHDPGIDGSSGATTSDTHSCSVCGSCCSAGALLGSAPGLPRSVAAATAFFPVVASVDPYAADGPDRPPRHLLV